LDEEITHSRVLSLQQWLDQLCASPSLRYSPELAAFLTDPKADLLSKDKPKRAILPPKEFLNDSPMKIYDLEYPGGKIHLLMNGTLRKVTKEIKASVGFLGVDEAEAVVVCKQIVETYENLKKLMATLSTICGKVSEEYSRLSKEVKFPSVSKLSQNYNCLKEVVIKQSQQIGHDGKIFQDNIQAMFDFSLRELEGIDQVSPISS